MYLFSFNSSCFCTSLLFTFCSFSVPFYSDICIDPCAFVFQPSLLFTNSGLFSVLFLLWTAERAKNLRVSLFFSQVKPITKGYFRHVCSSAIVLLFYLGTFQYLPSYITILFYPKTR